MPYKPLWGARGPFAAATRRRAAIGRLRPTPWGSLGRRAYVRRLRRRLRLLNGQTAWLGAANRIVSGIREQVQMLLDQEGEPTTETGESTSPYDAATEPTEPDDTTPSTQPGEMPGAAQGSSGSTEPLREVTDRALFRVFDELDFRNEERTDEGYFVMVAVNAELQQHGYRQTTAGVANPAQDRWQRGGGRGGEHLKEPTKGDVFEAMSALVGTEFDHNAVNEKLGEEGYSNISKGEFGRFLKEFKENVQRQPRPRTRARKR